MTNPWHKSVPLNGWREQTLNMEGQPTEVWFSNYGPLCGADVVIGVTRQHPWSRAVTCEACLTKMRESDR